MRIHLKSRIITILSVMALTALMSPAAFSESYKVSQFRYTNRGEYVACPEVVWNDASGRQQVSLVECVKRGHTVVLELADLKNPPTADSEVWLLLRIAAGDVQNCRSKTATFHFDPGGARAKFRSDGTHLDRNECKLTCEDCKAK